MNRHTPAPWRVGSVEKWHIFGDIGNESLMAPTLGRVVARLNEHFPYEADAHLIAAAPDLLAVVQRYVDSGDECVRGGASNPKTCPCVACDLTREARAALAKARGK